MRNDTALKEAFQNLDKNLAANDEAIDTKYLQQALGQQSEMSQMDQNFPNADEAFMQMIN